MIHVYANVAFDVLPCVRTEPCKIAVYSELWSAQRPPKTPRARRFTGSLTAVIDRRNQSIDRRVIVRSVTACAPKTRSGWPTWTSENARTAAGRCRSRWNCTCWAPTARTTRAPTKSSSVCWTAIGSSTGRTYVVSRGRTTPGNCPLPRLYFQLPSAHRWSAWSSRNGLWRALTATATAKVRGWKPQCTCRVWPAFAPCSSWSW